MAGPPTEHLKPHHFKPGQSGNPGGKPKNLITSQEVHKVASRFLHMTQAEVQDIIDNPKTSMLEVMIARVLQVCVQAGDPQRFNLILDRTVGKVKELSRIEVDKPDEDLKKIPIENLVTVLKAEERAVAG